MTTGALVAEVGCPVCNHVLARVRRDEAGGLSVEYRSPKLKERSGRQPVLSRTWETWESTPRRPGSWSGCECACQNVRCGGRFVLDDAVVAQLAERSGAMGAPVRWQPIGAAVERSDRLVPTFHIGRYSREAEQVSAREKLTPPPALDFVRRLTGIRANGRAS
jgi:hypothetical protein